MFKFVARGMNFLLGKSFQNQHIFLSSSLEYLKNQGI